MPKCPSCSEDIDHLIAKQTFTSGFAVEDGKPVYERDSRCDFYYVNEPVDSSWHCPICEENLFSAEDEAIRFLEGKEVKNDSKS